MVARDGPAQQRIFTQLHRRRDNISGKAVDQLKSHHPNVTFTPQLQMSYWLLRFLLPHATNLAPQSRPAFPSAHRESRQGSEFVHSGQWPGWFEDRWEWICLRLVLHLDELSRSSPSNQSENLTAILSASHQFRGPRNQKARALALTSSRGVPCIRSMGVLTVGETFAPRKSPRITGGSECRCSLYGYWMFAVTDEFAFNVTLQGLSRRTSRLCCFR
jgi:hypothetical protein